MAAPACRPLHPKSRLIKHILWTISPQFRNQVAICPDTFRFGRASNPYRPLALRNDPWNSTCVTIWSIPHGRVPLAAWSAALVFRKDKPLIFKLMKGTGRYLITSIEPLRLDRLVHATACPAAFFRVCKECHAWGTESTLSVSKAGEKQGRWH